MPRRQQKPQDEPCSEIGESVVLKEQAEDVPDVQMPSPVVTRTRSGRRVRTPANLIDSQVTSLKTPSRRTRKDGKDVSVSVSGSTAPDQNKEAAKQGASLLEHETKKPKIDGIDTTRAAEEAIYESINPTISTQEKISSLSSVTGLVTFESNGKENQSSLKTVSDCVNNTKKMRTDSTSKVTPGQSVPLGKPKSGRVWKNRNKQRFSALLRDKPLRSSWQKKMEAKREKELVKKYSRQLKEEKAREKEEKRKRREESLRRREENERRAEIVQVIRNPVKMKRMKKKQLRRIEKRDTLMLLHKSQSQNKSAAAGVAKGSN